MNLIPFFESSVVIQFHVYAALFALFLGGFVLSVRKGTGRHKFLGRVWGGAMIFVALSSFWIHEIKILGPFSPIHLLSILVLFSIVTAVLAARRGDIKRHQRTMKSLYFFGLITPGLFTFLPHRLMNEVFIQKAAAAEVISSGTPSMVEQIVAKTPVWVWPLFIGLIIVGFMHTREYAMSKWRTFILPITFSITALIAAFSSAKPIFAIIVIVLAALLFVPLGIQRARASGATLNEKEHIVVPGEWTTLLLFIAIFASRFAAGIVGGANPTLANGPIFISLIAVFSGAIVGIAIGRTVAYLKMYEATS